MKNHKPGFARIASLALALSLFAAPLAVSAAAVEGTLTIVTSYPKDTTGTFKKAFEKKYPNVKVEMLKKKTTAGIKYLQETAGSNTSDMFWASAPDAFEVLKGDDLLVKYQVKVKGIPEKVGSFPINDPDGYYKGFAASGYGIMWNTRYLKAKKLPVPAEWSDLKKPVYFGHAPHGRDPSAGQRLGKRLGPVEGHRRQLQNRDRAQLRCPRRCQQRPVRRRHRHRLLRAFLESIRIPG
jgi:Bacterial extracellular solute-binding protein